MRVNDDARTRPPDTVDKVRGCEGAKVRGCGGARVRGSGTVVPIRSLINAAREAARAIRAASDVSGMPVETIHAREDS